MQARRLTQQWSTWGWKKVENSAPILWHPNQGSTTEDSVSSTPGTSGSSSIGSTGRTCEDSPEEANYSSPLLEWLYNHFSVDKCGAIKIQVICCKQNCNDSRQRHFQQLEACISKENPADVASTGIMPHELKSHQLWFHGPYWLAGDYTPPPPPTKEMRKIKT